MRQLLFASLICAACGGSPAPTRAAATGSINGDPVTVYDAALVIGHRTAPAFATLRLTNQPDSCNPYGTKDLQLVALNLVSNVELDGGSIGVYDDLSGSIPPAQYARVEVLSARPDCSTFTPANAKGASGRVTFTRYDLGADGGAEGSFDVILESGDRIKGTFTAPLCPEVADAGTADAGCR